MRLLFSTQRLKGLGITLGVLVVAISFPRVTSFCATFSLWVAWTVLWTASWVAQPVAWLGGATWGPDAFRGLLNFYWTLAMGNGSGPISSFVFGVSAPVRLLIRITVELSLAGAITVPILYWSVWRWAYGPLRYRWKMWVRSKGVQTPWWLLLVQEWTSWFFYGPKEWREK